MSNKIINHFISNIMDYIDNTTPNKKNKHASIFKRGGPETPSNARAGDQFGRSGF
jgi:hypothetical protein